MTWISALISRLRHNRFARQFFASVRDLVLALMLILVFLILETIRLSIHFLTSLWLFFRRNRFFRQLLASARNLVPVIVAILVSLIRDTIRFSMHFLSSLRLFFRRNRFFRQLLASVLDLVPVIVVILVFQVLVIRQPIPDVGRLISGMLLVVLGLTFFVQGLHLGLFPLGESMAHAFARKGSVFWLILFAFALGFGTSVAEPALIAVADEAARVAAEGGLIQPQEEARQSYALGLRLTVAFAVGFAVVVGVIRIIRGWPLPYVVIAGYLGVAVMTPLAPPGIIGIAYDSGGVTTSTITVPLITALAVGLSSSIRGRNPVVDGFGVIAIATLAPMIFVMVYGAII